MTPVEETLRAEIIARYVAAVRRCPEAYKQRVRDDPEASARGIIEGLNEKELAQFLGHMKAEERALRRAGY